MDKNDFRRDLKKDLKIMKRNKVIAALIFVALGAVLLAWPRETLDAVSRIIALILAFGGAVAVVMYFVNGSRALFSYAGLAGGIIIGVIGVCIFFNPVFMIQLIPTIVGLMLVISGLVNFSEAFTIRKEHGEGVLMSVILAAVTIVLGILIFSLQEMFAELITRLMGLALIYDGVSDLLIISKITGVVKAVECAAQQAAQDAEAIDVTESSAETEAQTETAAGEQPSKPRKRFTFGWRKKEEPQNAAGPDDFEPDDAEETPHAEEPAPQEEPAQESAEVAEPVASEEPGTQTEPAATEDAAETSTGDNEVFHL